MGNKELKPCPFCGNDNVHCETETGLFQVKHTFIRCDICGASGWVSDASSI